MEPQPVIWLLQLFLGHLKGQLQAECIATIHSGNYQTMKNHGQVISVQKGLQLVNWTEVEIEITIHLSLV